MLDQLQRAGLNRNQANVYHGLLRLGKCTVQQLANATGLNRVTTTGVVEQLERMQLCYSALAGKTRFVMPMDPMALRLLLRSEAEQLRDREAAYRDVAATLQGLYEQPHRRPEVMTLTGDNTYPYLIEDVLKANQESLEMLNVDESPIADLETLGRQYFPRKYAQGIPTRIIVPATPTGHRFIDRYYHCPGASPTVVRFLPLAEFQFATNFLIYGGQVAFMSPTEQLVIRLTEREVNLFMRSMFEFIWKRAGEEASNR